MRNHGSVSLAACLTLALVNPARADDQAEMKAVLARAIKAIGGEKTVAKYKGMTWKIKGKVFIIGDGTDFTGEWSLQYPEQSRAIINLTIDNTPLMVTRIFNQGKGWFKLNNKTIAMDKKLLAEERDQTHVHTLLFLLPLKNKAFTLAPVGETRIGEHDAVGMKVTRKDWREINLYFDKKTGLLLKAESIVTAADTGQEVSQEWFFDDYKKTEGIKYPAKIKIQRDGKKYVNVEETTEFKPAEKLDDSEFAKP